MHPLTFSSISQKSPAPLPAVSVGGTENKWQHRNLDPDSLVPRLMLCARLHAAPFCTQELVSLQMMDEYNSNCLLRVARSCGKHFRFQSTSKFQICCFKLLSLDNFHVAINN